MPWSMNTATSKKSAWALREEAVQKYWEDNDIFPKTLSKKSPKGDFVFYDGPPFATGLPHYGHIVASCLKDVIPRFKTMQGYHVPRRWGWDCHGLPIENLIEKEFKFETKKDIIAYGIDKFNEACRSKVLEFANDWKVYIKRLGRFVDMENGYKTMDLSFMESVWWVFKRLWDKQLVYEGYKSMHICPRCETTLSQSEVAEGYVMIKDISAIASFELVDEPGTFFLAWTTTPWTLPGNVALAVNTKISYTIVAQQAVRYIVADSLVEKIFAGTEYVIAQKDIDIKKYIGNKYRPLFPYYEKSKIENYERLYTVQSADFVTETDGTGIVHIAPAFGDDDYRLGQEEQLPFIQNVRMDGTYTDEVIDFAGKPVKPKGDHSAMDIEIIKYLATKKLLFSKEKYEHAYPHCWRCDTPLLNYAKSSWFVKVTDIKDKLIKNNQQTYWFPEHLKDGRSGQWLEGARDWSISRERFWASVMPVWRCEKCRETLVIGSLAELQEYSGQEIVDLHKHIVDAITFPCSCGATMRRIPEVLDTWFDSGSMPFAQQHYLGKGTQKFDPEKGVNFPADFIAEGIDQTRCWFYYLNVIATGVIGKQAFKHVLVNGTVLAADGQKMSKRLNNYPNPLDIMNAYGADALRFYLMSSPVVKAEDFNFIEQEVREVYNKVINTLWNVFTFYSTYFPTSDQVRDFDISTLRNPLDRWMVSKLQTTLQDTTVSMEKYMLHQSARSILDFISELSQWYLRRTRERIKSEDNTDAGATLFYVLRETSKLIAPFCPFIAEELYRGLGEWKGKYESVHLESWPELAPDMIHAKLMDQMQSVRELIEQALALRAKAGVKVRQPLARLTINSSSIPEELYSLIADEVNVKEVIFDKKIAGLVLDTEITDRLRIEGHARELIRQINSLRKEQGLSINDHVALQYETTSPELREALQVHGDDIQKNTISKLLQEGSGEHELDVNGNTIKISLIA